MLQGWCSSTIDSLFEDVMANRPVPYSVIHTSEDSISYEIEGKLWLNCILLLFLSIWFQTEEHVLWYDPATAHYAGATADLLAEVEVPLVASEMNLQASLSRGQSRISHVLNQVMYHGGWTASSDQIWAWIVKDVEKIDPHPVQKFGQMQTFSNQGTI